MSKFNVASKYVAATPRSQRRKGVGVSSAPSSGVTGSGVDKNTLAQYVDLISPQDVEGLKNFVNGLLMAGKLIRYDADKDALVIPMNLIVEKEAAWNSSPDGFDVPTFMDAVRVDNITIKKDNGVLTVIGGAGGSGGGVADSVLWSGIIGKPTTIEGYGITDAYTKSAVDDLLSKKWTQDNDLIKNWNAAFSWGNHAGKYLPVSGKAADSALLNGQGLVDANGRNGIPVSSATGYMEVGRALDFHLDTSGVDYSTRLRVTGNNNNVVDLPSGTGILALVSQIPTNNNQLTNGAGYITGINSLMITTALGYTPYNAANFTKANIKSTLGISDWALTSVKPTYTASEVGALPKSGGTVDGSLEVTSTIKGNSVIAATRKMRVNAGDSPINFGYMRAETFSSNRGLVHIGSNYGGSSTITNDAVDVDAIGIYRSVIGVGRTYTGDELKSAYDSNIKFLVEGNMRATGEIVWNSSRVLKNIVNDEPTYLSMEDMLKIKPYRYTWKDGRDDKVHAGGIADEVLEVLPEVIVTDSEGIHSMDYGQASFTVATSLVPHVNRHEEEINALKRRVKELEELVTKLLENNGRV